MRSSRPQRSTSWIPPRHRVRLRRSAPLTSPDALLGVQLALFYAAIKANGASTLQVGPEVLLSVSSCPSAFTGILTRCIEIATDLARLCPDARHDVGRCVVDLEMLSSPVAAAIPLIVKNLRQVALEISQASSPSTLIVR